MIILFFKKHILKNKDRMTRETRIMHNFLPLLVKPVNTRTKWTKNEISQLKSQMKHLAFSLSVIIMFVLPFGILLLPLYIELLDKREKRGINT